MRASFLRPWEGIIARYRVAIRLMSWNSGLKCLVNLERSEPKKLTRYPKRHCFPVDGWSAALGYMRRTRYEVGSTRNELRSTFEEILRGNRDVEKAEVSRIYEVPGRASQKQLTRLTKMITILINSQSIQTTHVPHIVW